MQKIAEALNGSSAAQAVFDLAQNNGAPVALRDIGMKEADLDKATLRYKTSTPIRARWSALRSGSCYSMCLRARARWREAGRYPTGLLDQRPV